MKKILIINANYYTTISHRLVNSAKKVLKKNKFNISILTVPGIFEIPIALRRNIKNFDAFITLGCVIKGKTPHFEFISKTTFKSILDISVKYNKPIGNGIITSLNIKQAKERCGINKSNKSNKGLEAANAVVYILNNGPKKI